MKLDIATLGAWLDNSNFRITTDYIFELLNVTDSSFYKIWASGGDGYARITIANVPDTTSVRLNFRIDNFPDGNDNSNYRIKSSGEFQLYNVDTGLWHSVWVGGTKANPTLELLQEGEE